MRALHAPVNTLVANWAYMVMAALAWSLKAWCALLLPVSPRWARRHEEQRRQLLTMEFRTFRRGFHRHPLPDRSRGTSGALARARLEPWLGAFFRLLDAL